MHDAITADLIVIVVGAALLLINMGPRRTEPEPLRKLAEDIAALGDDEAGRAIVTCEPGVVLSLIQERAKKILSEV